MRRHPNPPGCAVAGALARHPRGARRRLQRRAATLAFSSRRYRPLRAPPSTRTSARPNPTPRPGSRARVPVPSRRPTGGVAVDAREAVRGWTDEPNRRARPRRRTRLRTRVRDATSATLAARVAKPRPPRTLALRGIRPAHHEPIRGAPAGLHHTAPKEKDCLSHICRPILLASSCASPCASPSALGSHARGSSRSSRSSRSGPRWGRAATPANQCFKATSAVVPKESIRRASGVAAALGVCAAKPSTRAIPVTPAAGVVTAAAATTVPPVTTESMKVRDSAILVTPTARRAK